MKPTFEERFWAKVQKTDTCWLWTGARTKLGYGHFGVAQNKIMGAHRVAYLLLCGPITESMFVCHNCPGGDNPSCVNPAHLFLGTALDNVQDRHQKGRDAVGMNAGAGRRRLSSEQVTVIRARYAAGGVSMAALGREYTCTQQNIHVIIRGGTWRHL